MERIIKAVIPFFAVECVILLLLIFFPVLVTGPAAFFMGK